MRPTSLATRLLGALLLWGGAAAAVGCGTPGATSAGTSASSAPVQAVAATPDQEHIVAVYQSHCGSCHRPVAPGSEPSDRLATELRVHRKRARLTEQEWAGLDAFLVARP
jgi:cytochrome c5